MWKLIDQGNVAGLKEVLAKDSSFATVRSGDGRGPLWWAYEKGNSEIIQLLKKHGARDDARDGKGSKPVEMIKKKRV